MRSLLRAFDLARLTNSIKNVAGSIKDSIAELDFGDVVETADIVGDTAVEVLQLPSRFVKKQGDSIEEFGKNLMALKENIQDNMPDRPEVIADSLVGGITSGVRLVTDVFNNLASCMGDTGEGIRRQIGRITG